MADNDSIRHIPIIMAYVFMGLSLILMGFIIIYISHRIYKTLTGEKDTKEKLKKIIQPSSFDISTKARKSLKQIKKNVARAEVKPLQSLRKTTLG